MSVRVAHVISTPTGMGGAERVLSSLAHAIEGWGWPQVVLNPFELSVERSEVADSLPAGVYRSGSYRTSDLVRARSWLRSQIADFRPQIVHAQLIHSMALVASLKGPWASMVSHQHGDYFSAHGMRAKTMVDRWSTLRFDKVVAVSCYVEHFLEAAYGVENSRIEVVPNGWQGDPLPRRFPARPTIISVSNMRRGKGHDVLLAALPQVLARVPQASLVLVGTGPLRGEIESTIETLDLRESVEVVGAVDDVWPHLARANVMVLPSLTETSGIAAMEAMAAGLPVVASRVGGLPELIEEGRSGLLVPPQDPGSLAEALVKVLEDPVLADAWGSRGRDIVEAFHTRHMVERYRLVYENLADVGT